MNSNVTPWRLQVAHPVEQPLDAARVQLGGRLVEDDEPGAEGQGSGDLDHLALLDAEVGGRALDVDVDAPLVQQCLRLAGAARAS